MTLHIFEHGPPNLAPVIALNGDLPAHEVERLRRIRANQAKRHIIELQLTIPRCIKRPRNSSELLPHSLLGYACTYPTNVIRQ